MDQTIEYKGNHLSKFTWSQKEALVLHQEFVLWFFDIIFEHLLSIQALSRADRFPRYAHSLLVTSRSMLEGAAILNWLMEGAEADQIEKANLTKQYISFKNLIEAKNDGEQVLSREQEKFIEDHRFFLKKKSQNKLIEEIKENDLYRDFYQASNPDLNISVLIERFSHRLETESHFRLVYKKCSEIAHFNPAELYFYMIRETDTLFFDSENIELIGASLLIAMTCSTFAVDMVSQAFRIDISEFRALIEKNIG